jgi:preprotein translocase subunit Sss1
MDAPKMAGMIVIGAVGFLVLMAVVFKGNLS